MRGSAASSAISRESSTSTALDKLTASVWNVPLEMYNLTSHIGIGCSAVKAQRFWRA
jgi:hypothetical protein